MHPSSSIFIKSFPWPRSAVSRPAMPCFRRLRSGPPGLSFCQMKQWSFRTECTNPPGRKDGLRLWKGLVKADSKPLLSLPPLPVCLIFWASRDWFGLATWPKIVRISVETDTTLQDVILRTSARRKSARPKAPRARKQNEKKNRVHNSLDMTEQRELPIGS